MAGKNKTIRNVVIGVVALAVLAGVYFLVTKWEPKQETEEQPQQTQQKIQIFQASAADAVQVDVSGSDGNLKYYKKKENKTVKDASGNDTTKEADVWYIAGYEEAKLTATKIENTIYDFSDMKAEMEVTSDMSKKADYGLETPSARATLSMQDGTQYTMLLGAKVPTSDNYYAMLEGKDTIYVITGYKANIMLAKPLSYKNTMIGSITVDDFQTFSLSANGQKVIDVRKLKEDDNLLNANMTTYVMTYPNYEAVRAEEFKEILDSVASVTATEFVAFAPADLSVYGLSQPRYVVSLADSKNSYRISIGANVPKEEGETVQRVYAIAEGDPCVFTMSATMLDSLKSVDAFSLMEKFMHLVNVSDVQSVVVESEGKTYTLDVEHFMDKNDVGEEFEEQRYKINGKDANQKRSKAVYQSIIGQRASGSANGAPGAVRCTITFRMTDGTQSVMQYADYDERNDTVIKDGTPSGFTVLKQGIIDMMKQLEELDADPTKTAS